MNGIFTYMYNENQPNADKYTIHGWYGFPLGTSGCASVLSNAALYVDSKDPYTTFPPLCSISMCVYIYVYVYIYICFYRGIGIWHMVV